DPLNMQTLDQEIGIGLPTDGECKELIDRVFVMPRASDRLVQDFIEKSDRLPSNLVSLLERLTEKHDGLLEFFNPLTGVRVHDRKALEELPTTLLQSERKAAVNSNISREVLACLAAFRGPLTAETVRSVLRKLGRDPGLPAVEADLKDCQRHHWLQPAGN